MATAIVTALGGAGIQGVISGLIVAHKVDKWAKLIWKTVLSYWVTSSGTAGLALMKGASYPFAIGTGLFLGAIAAGTAFYTDPLSKGMSIQVPEVVLEQAAMDQNAKMHEVQGGQK